MIIPYVWWKLWIFNYLVFMLQRWYIFVLFQRFSYLPSRGTKGQVQDKGKQARPLKKFLDTP